jgi:hypothetical protein
VAVCVVGYEYKILRAFLSLTIPPEKEPTISCLVIRIGSM